MGFLHSQEIGGETDLNIEAERDSLRAVSDLDPRDAMTVQDTTETDTIVKKPELLTDIVTYTASDYMRLSRKENKMYLYDEAKIVYGDIEITAGLIILDNEKNEVYAYGIVDSTGAYIQKPIFTQAQNVVRPDSIRFNFDTEKALVYNTRTEQGAFKVKGEVTKRENDSVFFMKNVRFTTSIDEENPEYYFYARRIKFVPDKKIVTGLVNMVIADVPTPLGLPFAFFPLTEEEASGFIIPSVGESSRRGYFLQNGGYYFAISDYLDLALTGDYYTNGSYGLRVESSYAKRYRYRGNVSFRMENLIESERGFPDYFRSSIYNFRWSHSQDAKANPTSRFSASVNLGSSTYYRESINAVNAGNVLNNTLSSSISYQKTFRGEPQVNLSVSATHYQNVNTQDISMTLPTLQASMSSIFPFAPKDGSREGIIDNINFQYNLRAENRFETTDSLFLRPAMFDGMVTGASHSIPVSTNFKLLNYLNVNAGTSYNEFWVFKTYDQYYDPEIEEVIVDTVPGFDSYRTYNFHTNLSTSIYGLFNFGEKSKIKAIRHVMSPSIGYSINPDFSRYYDSYSLPALIEGEEEQIIEYSRFEYSLYGAPSNQNSSNINFSVSNTVEAKIRSQDSTGTDKERKITLLNTLRLSTAYNLEADSLALSPIRFTGSFPIIEDELEINFNGAMDVYALNNENRRIDKLNVNNGGSLLRFMGGSVSFDYSFSSEDFAGDGPEDEDQLENETFRNGGRRDGLFGQAMGPNGEFYDDTEEGEEDEEAEVDDNKLYNYEMPWTLSIAYKMNYSNEARQNSISAHSLMFTGNIELAPRWTVGVTSGFDFVRRGFSYTQLRFERDLESWRMSFAWRPFGPYESWNFFIGIKSSVLSDIKYDKNREPDREL